MLVGWDAINNQVPLAHQQLEDEFRLLLGAVVEEATADSGVVPDAANSTAPHSP